MKLKYMCESKTERVYEKTKNNGIALAATEDEHFRFI